MVRGSLGAVKLLGEEAVSHRYPMYVIKVTDLLELDKWVPHQDLVKAGKMIQVRSDLDVEVLFISSGRASSIPTRAENNLPRSSGSFGA